MGFLGRRRGFHGKMRPKTATTDSRQAKDASLHRFHCTYDLGDLVVSPARRVCSGHESLGIAVTAD